ncbi:hypothetical protein H0H92_008240 [Tricholoma furcatifolium]|nr:hypothetical protein H0H92_008240 [Tricholoma furcatifolium]
MIKWVETLETPAEIPIGKLLSSERLASPRNRCLTYLDVIEPSDSQDAAFIVMSYLLPTEDVPFGTIGEAVEFFRQIFEGLEFMHENNIRHGDCKYDNIMADAVHLYKARPHPFFGRRTLDLSGFPYPIFSRTIKPVKYYLIYFDLAKEYPPGAPRLERVPWGGDRTVPEHSLGVPCDPFPVDVYCLGNCIRENFVDGAEFSPAKKGFEFMRQLADDMTNPDPSKRPTMKEAASRLNAIIAGLSDRKLRSPVCNADIEMTLRESIVHWTKQFTLYYASRPNTHLRWTSNAGELEIDPHSRCPKLAPPVTLYDMHLDKGLSLRCVELIPSLTSNLKEAVDQISYEATGTPVEKDNSVIETGHFVTDAKTFAHAYEGLASYATIVASTLLLHPAAGDMDSVLIFSTSDVTRPQKYYAINEDYGPEILPAYDESNPTKAYSIPETAWDVLDADTRLDIGELRKRFPILAVWQMFFAGTEAGLRHMSDVAKLGEFPWMASHATDPYPLTEGVNMSPDDIDTAWGMAVSSFSSTPPITLKRKSGGRHTKVADGSIRLKGSLKDVQARERRKPARKRSAQLSSQEPSRWPTVSIPSIEVPNPPAHLLMSISMIQHAWARAVERDSTFIVFHCGTFERIGFRHRASQTLFLSDLIEPTKCTSLSYGHLHVGLFIAILKDSLDRVRQLTAGLKLPWSLRGSKEALMSRKRKRETQHLLNSNKRPRTRAAVAEETERRRKYARTLKAVSDEIKSRNLALLRIDDRHFNSFSASPFLRFGTKPVTRYEPRQYFRIHLASKLEEGATGDAQNATIELLACSGEVLSLPNVVVKIAFEQDQKDRLTNEFRIYEHLMSANKSEPSPARTSRNGSDGRLDFRLANDLTASAAFFLLFRSVEGKQDKVGLSLERQKNHLSKRKTSRSDSKNVWGSALSNSRGFVHTNVDSWILDREPEVVLRLF